MATLQEQLVKYLTDAHALEQQSLRQLKNGADTADDPGLAAALQQHAAETEQQMNLLRERLESHGASPSTVKDVGGTITALGKGLLDKARPDNVGKIARDAYTAEHLEIASYELLERVARRAGDVQTAQVAARIRAEEEAAATRITAQWDRVVERSLQQEGVTVP
jgi:ferritin-like metal-binding protein YciE